MALSDGLVGAWCPSLGATAGTLLDRAGRNNHGTLTNMDPATDWVQSGGRGALDFDGVNDFVSLGNSASLNPTTAISLACWVRYSASVAIWCIGRDDATLGRSFALGVRASSDRVLSLQINGTQTIASSLAVPQNTWTHLAITGSPGIGYRAYQDGVQTGSATWGAPASTTGSTTIGARTYAGSQGYWAGQIDDAGIWARGLTPPEIQQLYRQGRGAWLRQTRRRTYGFVQTGNRRRRLICGANC